MTKAAPVRAHFGTQQRGFVPDVGEQTSYFLKVLKVNGGRTLMQRHRLGSDWWIWFYQAVKPGGAWDLKLWFRRRTVISRRSSSSVAGSPAKRLATSTTATLATPAA